VCASTRVSRLRPTSASPRQLLRFDPPIAASLEVRGDQLILEVSGKVSEHLELDHMRDRIEATSGSLTITHRNGRTVIEVSAPCAVAPVQLAPA